MLFPGKDFSVKIALSLVVASRALARLLLLACTPDHLTVVGVPLATDHGDAQEAILE